jgi:serine phosphatase RsbU (regulator of sigma subunit)
MITDKIVSEFIQQKEARFGSFLITPLCKFNSISPQAVVDYFPMKHGGFMVAIFEVVNESRDTLAISAMIKSLVRVLSLKFPDNPANILHELNKSLMPYHSEGNLVTGFIGMVDVTNDALKCSNAGHPFPMVLSSKGVEQLSQSSTPLGIIGKAKFSNHEVSLKNKQLFLFTQGMINLSNQDQTKLGSDGLSKIIENSFQANQKEITREIENRLSSYSKGIIWLPDYVLLHIRSGI